MPLQTIGERRGCTIPPCSSLPPSQQWLFYLRRKGSFAGLDGPIWVVPTLSNVWAAQARAHHI
eukprot:12578345-Alexandrium_andersonii.AAC.1